MIGALLAFLAALLLAALPIAVSRTPRGEVPFPHEHGDGEP